MNRCLYTLLFHLGLPFIALRLWWRGRKAPAYRLRVGERFGFGLPLLRPGGVWLHAVSVGESIAAAPLVRALLAEYPQRTVLITCMTPTGSQRIQAMFADEPRVQHCYLPYDLPWAARRFLDQAKPALAVVMETELWPNYIHQCARRGIAIALANGRLSARSAKGYARFPQLTRPMLASLSLIAAQTQAEAERFLALGARPSAVQVTGSIKFDLAIDPALPARAAELREQWHAGARPVWIAASTHEGEDAVVLAAHRQLLVTHSDALLILVPRHPERFEAVARQVAQAGLAQVRRSANQPVTAATQVLVGDTMGELLFYYALADIAFVGGSLVATGGHNLLEPAALSRPVLTGPHLFNFLDIAAQLQQAHGLKVVDNADELASAVRELIELPQVAERMSAAGLAVMRANQGALRRLLGALAQLL
ncbi:lipid IV(A) 3-deoxy-D-manno-octulosonic acid transferase [Pseudomonas typographi]|uniref:3-deoxy-D-manno-octulosonic acid transferase n=1 Tax=Pseudomonas typographi TaxID=2715964 RepID=A0ABR7YVU1_9PSED|nr:lipid IV(A) 3-deoxy-D-manno-octulosonic acid transferase [Pseudomonas typographi]MBD1549852.1 3-deoxy-D-manno-octulosonic acid transferase [Pseudomonas typographi]MBD1585233.1 3-deoxy-D-manno-octulosonic acid transferase [Pseudomonas typographi]MBD1597280.1 3-deoxy-D-manno-octulosonic acid transferase [Pseudomonas typographi]